MSANHISKTLAFVSDVVGQLSTELKTKVSIKCSECDSDRHLAALHPGPAPSNTDTATAETEHGGEQGDDALLSVTSKCTEICGEAVNPRSCSKICLVKAYLAGKREKAVKMYVVLDEQSNKSLAKTEFFSLFNINDNSAPYTMKTCSGVTETSGRRAVNFMVVYRWTHAAHSPYSDRV